MAIRYYRRWNATRGDEFDSWGAATYYFEVGRDGWPTRQVEVYDASQVLRYGPGHEEDQYGQLARARLDVLEDWAPWAVSHDDCEEAWTASS